MKKYFQLSFLAACAVALFLSCARENEPELEPFSHDKMVMLDSVFDAAMSSYEIPGAIVGIWSPSGNYLSTRGFGDLGNMEPMSVENHFRIGSVTKTFTGTIVLMLAEEGKIDLDGTLAEYLPQYNFPESDKITVRMLGDMTSGIFDCTRDTEWVRHNRSTNWETVYTADSLVKIALSHPLDFEPGTRYNYTNTTPLLLGLICESVTGKTMKQLMEERLFEPFGLSNTVWPDNRYLTAPYSHGYSKENSSGEFKDMSLINPSYAGASGNLISNVFDLKKWITLLGSGELYSSAMHAERLKWAVGSSNTYGFAIKNLYGITDQEGLALGHAGAIWGYNTMAFYFPSLEMAVIIHVNYYSRGETSPAEPLLLNMLNVALE